MKAIWLYSVAGVLALGAVTHFHGMSAHGGGAIRPDLARAAKPSGQKQVVVGGTSPSPHARATRTAPGRKLATAEPRVFGDGEAPAADPGRSRGEPSKGRTLFGEQRIEASPRAHDPRKLAGAEWRRAQAETMNPRVERRLEALRAELASVLPGQRRALELDIEALKRNVSSRQRRAEGSR